MDCEVPAVEGRRRLVNLIKSSWLITGALDR